MDHPAKLQRLPMVPGRLCVNLPRAPPQGCPVLDSFSILKNVSCCVRNLLPGDCFP